MKNTKKKLNNQKYNKVNTINTIQSSLDNSNRMGNKNKFNLGIFRVIYIKHNVKKFQWARKYLSYRDSSIMKKIFQLILGICCFEFSDLHDQKFILKYNNS